MAEVRLRHFLPALMGSLRQQSAEGELVLEQNDGTRRIYWAGGNLKYMRSDAVGEQFGNFLIRRGVLDMASLKELLADGEGARVGDRVVQWGLMSVEERDARLHELLGSILLHAMEHPILKMTWLPGGLDENLSGDLQFRLDHRRLVWDVFQIANIHRELQDMFRSEPEWRWQAPSDLLNSLSDLPLNPKIAYALTMLGSEHLGYDTLLSCMGLPSEETARLVATLWALGGLSLTRGELPLLPKVEPPPKPPVPEPEPELEMVVEPIQLELEDIAPLLPLAPVPGLASRYHGDPVELQVPELEIVPEPSPTASTPDGESAMERARRLVIKAKSYMVQERTSEAIRALEQSIKLDGDSPESYEAWLMLGRLRLSNPAWSTRAVEALQMASRVNPKAAEPWALMGDLYRRKGFKANAQGCFRRALDLDPSVAVPADWAAAVPEPAALKETNPGLLGRLKTMLGRTD